MASSCILIGAVAALVGGTSGDEAIQQADAAMTTAVSQYFVYEAATQEPGKEERVFSFAVTIKGREWRRIEFLAPGDIKGMKILVRSVSSMYVYLPAFGKVRRLASHVKAQGFMGTAFGHEDFSLATYGGYFTGQMVAETERSWKVEASRREGAEVPFSKLMLEIRRDILQPVKIEYFNDRGVKTKTETRIEFKCIGTACSPRMIKMVDHTRNDIETTLVRREWKPNPDVPDSFFTVRALQRGH